MQQAPSAQFTKTKRWGVPAFLGSISLRGAFQFRRKFEPALFQALGFFKSCLQAPAAFGHLGWGRLVAQLRLQRCALALQRSQALVDLVNLSLDRAQLLCPLRSRVSRQPALLARVWRCAACQVNDIFGSSA